ncbi:MAG: hypothetical protein P0S96_07015 [Simkaniaceae bacterium]|nr:hypothetical protein [Candidatus Sacchlamyda saccharinae]
MAPVFEGFEPNVVNGSPFSIEGAANASEYPVFEVAAASADNADVTLPEEDDAMRPATNATEEALRNVALTPQSSEHKGFFSFDRLNASFCPAPTEEEAPIALIDREVDDICPVANATDSILEEVAFVKSAAQERSNLDIAKDIAVGVAVVGSVVLKGIAAATTTALGSIFVVGALME